MGFISISDLDKRKEYSVKREKIFYGWWIVIGTAIILAMLGPAPVALANIFQTPITEEFNITNSQFALSNSFLLGIGIFVSPFVTQKLASGNFKRNYIINLLIYTIAYMSYGFAENIYIYYALSVIIGYGFIGTTITPVSILINNWFIHKRGLALSLALTGLGVGGVIFSQLVTFFINTFGWRQAYIIFGALMLIIVLLVMWFIIKVKPEDIGLEPLGNERFNPSAEVNIIEQTQEVDVPKSNMLRKPFFYLLIGGAALIGLVNNGGLAQFPPVLTEMHGPTIAATIISVYSGVGIAGKLILGNISDRKGVVAGTLHAVTMLVLTYLSMLFSGNIVFAFVMAGFFGMGNAIGTVMPPLITSAIYSTEDFPKAYGYVQSGMQFGMTVGSLFAAGIADLTGSYNYSWATLMVLAVFIAVLWVSAYKSSQKYID